MSSTDITSKGNQQVYSTFLEYKKLSAEAIDPRVKDIYARTALSLYSVLIGGPGDAKMLVELLKEDEKMENK